MLKNSDIQVLILCGGLGTRLRDVVKDIPKPLAPINGTPFLTLLMNFLKKQGFKKIKLLTGYLSEQFEELYGNGSKLDLEISYSVEETPLGTGGAVKLAINKAEEDYFICLNGDTFFDFNYELFNSSQSQEESFHKIMLRQVDNANRYGSIEMNSENLITEFKEKTQGDEPGLINSGVYFLHRSIIDWIDDGKVSLETDVFPRLVEEKKIQGIETGGFFIDIGIPTDFKKAQELLTPYQ